MDNGIHALGYQRFEELSQLLSLKILGAGLKNFGNGPDGGREATFEGRAKYPGISEQWDGYWVIQAKYKIVKLSSDANDPSWLQLEIKKELKKYDTRKIKVRMPDNLIFFTNINLSGAAVIGGRDKVETAIVGFKKHYGIKNIAIISYEDIVHLLRLYKNIRIVFRELILPDDIYYELLKGFVAEEKQKADSTPSEKSISQSLEKLLNRLRSISPDSPLIEELNPFEHFIYEYLDGDPEILEYNYWLSKLPFSQTWIAALELDLFNERFRKKMVQCLENMQNEGFAHYFSWIIFKKQVNNKAVRNIHLAKLYNDIIEASSIDLDIRVESFYQIIAFFNRFTKHNEDVLIPDIFLYHIDIAHEIFQRIFSIDGNEESIEAFLLSWQLASNEYKKSIVKTFNEYLRKEGYSLNAQLVSTSMSADDVRLFISKALKKTSSSDEKEVVFSEEESLLINRLTESNSVNFEEVINLYIKVSQSEISEVAHQRVGILIDFLLIEKKGKTVIQWQGNGFFKKLLLEVILNINISPVFSHFALIVMANQFGDRLITMDDRYPEIIFEIKNVRLHPNSLIGMLCDCASGVDLEKKNDIHTKLFLNQYRLLEEEGKDDLFLKLKKIVAEYIDRSKRLSVFALLINGDMTEEEFIDLFFVQ